MTGPVIALLFVALVAVRIGPRWIMRRLEAVPEPEPDDCLICGTRVRADIHGVYQCGKCGFDAGRARAAELRPLVAALTDLRVIRRELAGVRRAYADTSVAHDGEGFDLPRPGLDAVAPLTRDLLRAMPALLAAPQAHERAGIDELAAMLVGRPSTPATAWGGDTAGDLEVQRQQALVQLADWQRTLTSLHRALATRLAAQMPSPP